MIENTGKHLMCERPAEAVAPPPLPSPLQPLGPLTQT
eukprot:gene12502-biopygen7586